VTPEERRKLLLNRATAAFWALDRSCSSYRGRYVNEQVYCTALDEGIAEFGPAFLEEVRGKCRALNRWNEERAWAA
jgi:hypothetical protein